MIIPALQKTYKSELVLDLPELTVPDGSILAVCGQNGSGKSTLGRILAGITEPDSKKAPLPGLSVGYMAQKQLPFHMSVRRNLLLNSDRSLSREQNRKSADLLLEALGLEGAARKNARKLSGGQIQRMCLARILMKPYDLLILDEPTASMDQDIILAAEKLILDYHRRTGCTLLLISHSPEQVHRMTGQILLLEKGRPQSSELQE